MRIPRNFGYTIGLHIACLLSMLSIGEAQTDFIITPAYVSNGSQGFPNQKAIAVGSDGFVRFVTGNSSSGGASDEITYVRCLDVVCVGSKTATFVTGNATFAYSMTLGPDGFARIAYSVFAGPNVIPPHSSALGFIQCSDADCANFTNTIADQASDNGVASIAVGSDGASYIVYDYGYDSYDGISFYDEQGVGLATCNGTSCSTAQIAPINVFDAIGAAITIGANGNPAIVFEDSGNRDPAEGAVPDSVHYYANGTDTVVSSDGGGGNATQDVTVAADGFARIIFDNVTQGADFIQCTNTSCSSRNTSTISLPGKYILVVSLAVGADGNARIEAGSESPSAMDMDYVQCAGANCSGYNDESVPGNWDMSDDVASLALGLDGFARMIGEDSNDVVYLVRRQVELSCTSPVTRGGTTTCTVRGPFVIAVSGWTFVDSSGNPPVTRSTNTTSLTWSGTMVTSGTVSVTIPGISKPLTAAVTVNPRTTFAFTAKSPQQVMANSITCYNGAVQDLQSPPVNDTSIVGASCPDLILSFETAPPITDDGPNNGYQYVTSASDMGPSPQNQPTKYEFIVVSDLLSATTFYNAQCGTYSGTNPAGFIAGSQLAQNVFDHEQGSVLSHWTEYRDAQNDSSNNVGTVLETVVGRPGTSQADYATQVTNAGNTAMGRILAAVVPEPCNGSPKNDSSQSCKYCGTINYSPYISCGNSTPVPYCQ